MKLKAGLYVDRRSLEIECINALNNLEYFVNVYTSAKELLRGILSGELDLIITDSSIKSQDVHTIECYCAIEPNMRVLVIGDMEHKNRYLEAGCHVFTNDVDVAQDIANIGLQVSSMGPKNNSATSPWLLSRMDYCLYTPNNIKVSLTVREYKFLDLLFENNNVISKEQFKRKIIIHDYFNIDQRMALIVTRLRTKVKLSSFETLPVKSDYTHGYVFTAASCIDEGIPQGIPLSINVMPQMINA